MFYCDLNYRAFLNRYECGHLKNNGFSTIRCFQFDNKVILLAPLLLATYFLPPLLLYQLPLSSLSLCHQLPIMPLEPGSLVFCFPITSLINSSQSLRTRLHYQTDMRESKVSTSRSFLRSKKPQGRAQSISHQVDVYLTHSIPTFITLFQKSLSSL